MGDIRLVDPTDAQLLAASRFDGVHFAPVFDRHAATLHAYLERRLGRSGAVANLGETFRTAYGARRRFRVWEDSAHPWLLGVATGVVRKHWRAELDQLRVNDRRRVTPFGTGTATVARSAEAGADAVVERLAHLAARDRDVTILVAWEGLAPEAVAQALDLPDRVVASRLTGIGAQVLEDVGPDLVDLDLRPEDGIDLVRALRPLVSTPDPQVIEQARVELRVAVGPNHPTDAPRPTEAIAAEREQQRRWRTRPGRLGGAAGPRS